MQEFPPAEKEQQPRSTGVAADLRRERKSRGLTYEAVAKEAGLPNANTVKDVEYGPTFATPGAGPAPHPNAHGSPVGLLRSWLPPPRCANSFS